MLVELLIGVIVLILAWDYLKKRRRNAVFKASGIKSPVDLPIVGAALLFAAQTSTSVFVMLNNYTKKLGKTWYVWLMHEAAIVTADARIMEGVFGSQQLITKNRLYDLLSSWLGNGLLLSTGRKWHQRRKIITPTFHFKILEQFLEVFEQQGRIMVEKLYKNADGKTAIDIFPKVCLTALDIIVETAMGVKVNAQKDPDFKYVKSVTDAGAITAGRFLKPNQRFDTLMRWTEPRTYETLQNYIAVMHEFTDKVIADRRAVLEKSIADGTFVSHTAENDDIGIKKRLALLDVLLQATVDGEPLSNADIREEVDTFMFEGHDTTSSGISHILYLISRNPEVQQKLLEEIRAIVGDDKEKSVSMRELQDMKYLDCVIKEGLRLFPPVPIIGRTISEDTVIDGRLFPAKCNLIVLLYHAMRDPDYFPEPNRFNPERFSAESVEKIDPFAFVPFAAGPRNCIGQRFAMLEMKSTISKMLHHFELLPLGPEVESKLNLVLRSATGVHLGLKPRTY